MIPVNELITKVRTQNIKSILSNVFVTTVNSGGAVSSVSGVANQITVSPSTGAVIVSLPSSVIFPGTWAIGTLGYSDTGILFSAQSSTNSYNQAILQNTSNGATASTNFNVSNDAGTATTNFGEFGINSSGFTGSGSFSTAGYVYLAAATTDLVLGTYSSKGIHFVINSGATDTMTISSIGELTFNGSTTAIHKEIFNSLGITQTNGAGVWLQNTTAATNGNQQISPLLTLEGQGFGSGVNTSQSVKFGLDVLPVQAATNPTATFRIGASINGAGFSTVLSVTSLGVLTIGTGTSFINSPGSTFIFQMNGTEKARMGSIGSTGAFISLGSSSTAANIYISQPAMAAAWVPILRLDGGANTSLTTATEFIDINFNLARSVQWASGTVATQRQVYIGGVTLTGFSATATFTNAYSLYIDRPLQGTNASVTNSWAAGFNGNIKILDGFNIGFDTTTGSIIAITSSQKFAFWGKTPIVQPTTGIATATRVGGGGTTVTDTDTFGGYKIGQIVQALQNEGLLA